MNYQCDIPECESENWRVERFTITEKDASFYNLRLMINFQGHRRVEPGIYTRLRYKGDYDPVMSDTPAEFNDHVEFINRAEGDILINGLGLGLVLDACLSKTSKLPMRTVEHATVIEIDQELIDLVGPYYLAKYPGQITIICADALEYKPERNVRFGAVWHDIWPLICADNLADMKRLHRKYGRRTKFQGSWCRAECERYM